MGFLTPWILSLAAAGVLPFVAHLLKRRAQKPEPLPTLRWLERAMAATRRSRRFTDLLLLLLRVGLIVLAAIGAAGLFAWQNTPFSSNAPASICIVIDDSISMSRTENGRPLFESAKRRANELLDDLPRESLVSIVLAGKTPRVLVSPTRDLVVAKHALATIDHAQRSSALQSALALGMNILDGTPQEHRTLFVLSDFLAIKKIEASDITTSRTDIRYEQFGATEQTTDTAILSARRVEAEGTLHEASVEVTTFSTVAHKSVLRISSAEVQPRDVEIELPAKSGAIRIPLLARENEVELTLELADHDAITADNRMTLLPTNGQAARILLVSSDIENSKLLRAAIDATAESLGRPQYVATDPSGLSDVALSTASVIVILDGAVIDANAVERIRNWVARGGGLLFCAGDGGEVRLASERLHAVLPAKFIATTAAESHIADTNALSKSLVKVAIQKHAITDGVLEDAQISLRFLDGQPALITHTVLRGRAHMLAFPLKDGWSDVAYDPAFVALVAEELTALFATSARVIAVQPASLLSLGQRDEGATYSLESNGHQVPIKLDDSGEVEFAAPDVLGTYVVRRNAHEVESDLATVVVSPDSSDLDLTRGSAPSSTRNSVVGGETYRSKADLTPWIWLLFGLFFVFEAWLRDPLRNTSDESHAR